MTTAKASPAESPLLSPVVRDGTAGIGDEQSQDAKRQYLSTDSPPTRPNIGEATVKGARAASAVNYGAACRHVSKRLISRGWGEDGRMRAGAAGLRCMA